MSVDASLVTGDALADEAEAALARKAFAVACTLFDRAEPQVRDPDRCAGGRWMAHMLTGNFEAAWQESDTIRRRGAPDPHRFWQGEPLQGQTLMLRSLHGFGDAVQMLRFLPRLRAQVSRLILEVPPHFLELAPAFNGFDQVITWGEGAPPTPPAWDVQMEVMEVPYVLRVTTADLAPTQGYVQLASQDRAHATQVMGERRLPRVGVVWAAGSWNPARSVPWALFSELLHVEGIEFWSLQGASERQSWSALDPALRTRDVAECGDGLPRLAAVIEQLDLVVTVDTLAAHLAGALAIPCWVLLQHDADWRWMSDRTDTPWYPSVRLWRQAPGEGWAALLTRVRQTLQLTVDLPKGEQNIATQGTVARLGRV